MCIWSIFNFHTVHTFSPLNLIVFSQFSPDNKQTLCVCVILTGHGCGERPGDSADDWYRGACDGQLRPQSGGVSESPDLHTDSGTSVVIHELPPVSLLMITTSVKTDV